jgi:hypothetical protein
MSEVAPVNTGAADSWPSVDSAWATVRRMQTKLHRWPRRGLRQCYMHRGHAHGLQQRRQLGHIHNQLTCLKYPVSTRSRTGAGM